MKIPRILWRAAAVGVTGTMLGIGSLVAATPAHAMPRSECNYYLERALYWYDRYLHEKNAYRASVYLQASDAAHDVWFGEGCDR